MNFAEKTYIHEITPCYNHSAANLTQFPDFEKKIIFLKKCKFSFKLKNFVRYCEILQFHLQSTANLLYVGV